MTEKIGKVTLEYKFYSGNDSYTDGEVEDRLLEIVKNNPGGMYSNEIASELSWPVLYHLSDIRENIINWYDFKENASVLEIGSGCGAISGILSKKAKRVTAIELSKKRSYINAYKNYNCENLEILVGNFNDIADSIDEKFDYVTLIGVLEYAPLYISGQDPFNTFLNKIGNLLKPEGKIIIAIENQLGLKYFAGCKEDHIGKLFEGIEGYTNTKEVKTFSRKSLKRLISNNGYDEIEFYYPYPDYKLPDKIYSENHLPQKGDLVEGFRNFDSDRVVLFDESKAFDSIIEAGLFEDMANSFLVIASKKEA